MKLFDGKVHAQLLDKKIAEYLKTQPRLSTLLIIQIGDNLSSEKYVSLKKKFCEEFNIPVEVYKFSSDLSDDLLYKRVSDLLTRGYVGGTIIQLPLLRESLDKILDLIPPEKDVDLLSSTSQYTFYNKDFSRLPPTIRAYEYFIDSNNIKTENKKAALVGEGFLVGKPLAFYLKSKGADISIIKDYRVGRKLNAELLILSTGIPKLVSGEDISEGCNVIDFGSSIVDGKTVGDLNMDSKIDHLGIISPSPGGMGPLVVRFLIMNHLGI